MYFFNRCKHHINTILNSCKCFSRSIVLLSSIINFYPCELSEENIPLLCRIVCVVDAYDAMTSDRVYSDAVSSEQALIELIEHAGTQFDPHIVDIFLQVLNDARVLLP